MQLVLKNGLVVATHEDEQNVASLYPGCEVATYAGISSPGDPDPRTNEEKETYYMDQRRAAYPPIGDQLDMMFWDQINGTTKWRDAIAAVKNSIRPKV